MLSAMTLDQLGAGRRKGENAAAADQISSIPTNLIRSFIFASSRHEANSCRHASRKPAASARA
jgi:hypothetical protein